jgi:phosphoenolpyruvate carboxykinase (ATP)
MIDGNVLRNLSVDDLIKKALANHEVVRSKSGALVVYTGKYTGRSPNDKFIVDTPKIHNQINWGKVNIPMTQKNYLSLYEKISRFFSTQKEVYVVDAEVGADKKHSIKLRVYCQYAYQALFSTHLFRRPEKADLKNFKPDLTVYCAPSVIADPKTDGTNSEAFIVLNIESRTIVIGSTKYAGEIKKSVFTFMNYLLPQKNIFSMHCSANIEKNGKTTALFFGLSGTGKTTLSADPERRLIGDDEHGWGPKGVFNFEGGCYAKCIRIKKESEPQIWSAIHRPGSLVENVVLKKDGDFDFDADKFTENTRAVYPLESIRNSVLSGIGKHPDYVLFLTADATGVLPPVAHLTLNQAAYHFLSGYTSKLAGTERGIKEPKPTFSAYFGGPFMPLKPMIYLNLLKKYLKKHETKVFLVNTGWIAGPYGVGHRIPIKETRNIVHAVLSGKLDDAECRHDKIFNLYVPKKVPGVDQKILDPAGLWPDKNQYLQSAKNLARLFIDNMKKYPGVYESIINSGPKI